MNDPTNFQPGITLRNSLRQLLSGDQQVCGPDPGYESTGWPESCPQIHNSSEISDDIRQDLRDIETATRSVLSIDLSIPQDRGRLPEAIKALSNRVDDIDREGVRSLVLPVLKHNL